MKRVLLTSIMFLAIAGQARAAGTSGAQFLKQGAGARAAGMGDAFSSVADDVTAAYWNPAGLSQMEQPEISVMQNTGLVDSQYQYAAGAMPWGGNTLALSLYRMDYGTFDRYTAADTKSGSFNAGDLAGSLSLATKINEHYSAGVSAKYIQESIDDAKATTFAADFGVLAKYGDTHVSAVLQHFGPSMQMVKDKTPLPMTVRLGVSQRLFNRLNTALELSKPNDNNMTIHAGLEYALVTFVTMRAGTNLTPGNSLDVSGLKGFTAGLGTQFNGFSLDYAFVPFGDLGNTHRVSLSYKFAKAN
jgi:long-subunit fatty acid transport protein